MNILRKTCSWTLCLAMMIASLLPLETSADVMNINQEPLFLTQAQPPLVMLTMARDHRLYYEAYNDYSDLNGDGNLDIGYRPSEINYYGYFDSFKCYNYSVANKRFEPVSVSSNKQCGGVYWSGDFLNYVTTSRMDALRKVLYGGYRSTDTTSTTVLQRVYIPQEAHSWGKEYLSIAHDGYDISDYTPLTVPASGRRHIFASVTLTETAQTSGDTGTIPTLDATAGNEANNPPLLRVLQNSSLRVWNWLSTERPVAGANCLFGGTYKNCVTGDTAATGGWQVVPSSAYVGLSATFYDTSAKGGANATVSSKTDLDNLISGSPTTGTVSLTRIDCNSSESVTVYDDIAGSDQTYYSDCNPTTSGRDTTDEYYATVISGQIVAPTAGTYYFAIDGNNNVELTIDGTLVKGWYSGGGIHGFSDCDATGGGHYGEFDTTCNANNVGSIALTAGAHNIQVRQSENQAQDGYRLWWKVGTVPVSRQNYEVRVKVCDSTIGLEANCSTYTDGATVTYKPTGLLHTYGANNGMYFGLLTGSYKNNLQGGVLRKNVSSFIDEYSSTTGIFNSGVNGIVSTINKLRITGFRYSDKSYQAGAPSGACGWITTTAQTNGKCEMWGNPLGEMVYEVLRYFSGNTSPTASFDYSGTTVDSNTLGLPKPSWKDPYGTYSDRTPNSVPYCSKPYILAVSDTYPSFDSDAVPGTAFGAVTGDLAHVGTQPKVSDLGQTMWNNESGLGGTQSVFIGQSGVTFDSAPTAKSVSSFGNIRGLAPSDPTREGTYYTSALAYYGRTTDLRTDKAGTQKLGFYSVALAPPLPTIEIPVPGGDNKVTIVPFAKSVGGASINPASGQFQPTNQIVDFYVDTIKNTSVANTDSSINGGRPYYRFRINYEDVEQGADHDMDAIAIYDVWLNSDNSVTVNVVSEYAAGSIIQHMGYVISGTTADGTYLVVRDKDTAAGSDPNYFLDTPAHPGSALPLTFSSAVTVGTACVNSATNYACRTFTPSTSSGTAILLKDPLWYAAKWGGFIDENANDIPDALEWDADGNGVPDNYFLVVNPLKLEQQMASALAKISKDSGTASALSANSTSLRTSLRLFQARFSSDGWGGEVLALTIKSNGLIDAIDWQAQRKMAGLDGGTKIDPSTRVVLTWDPDVSGALKGIPFRWNSMTSAGALQTSLNKRWNSGGGTVDGRGGDRVNYLRGSTSISDFRTRPCITGTSGTSCVLNLLGDVVNSAIQYVGAPNSGLNSTGYRAYYNDRKNRNAMIYVGANDGMLHGFEADTGAERLAYIPASLYRDARLSKLTAPDYGQSSNSHAYYVDGSPYVTDVCRLSTTTDDNECEASGGAGDWKTILVGGLGAGGQAVYALDISRPEDFSEANASSLVLWEFSDKDDADLGLTMSQPVTTRVCTLRDSSSIDDPKACLKWRWVVIVSSGYNTMTADGYQSTSGYGHLFILDALTGQLLKKVATSDAYSLNALAGAALIDMDGDGIADRAYAGDLHGNMWHFDLDTVSTAAIKYKLYQAKTGTAEQPITTVADIVANPNGGINVLFGTGKYLEVSDKGTTDQQTFYGIWDNGAAVSTLSDRSNLQKQELQPESRTEGGALFSTSTRNGVDWSAKQGWYLDLIHDGSSPSERVVYDPAVVANVLQIVTVIPSTDVCEYGGTSWFFLLDPVTGASPDFAAFAGVPKISTTSGDSYASRWQSTIGIITSGRTITMGRGSGVVYFGGSKEGDLTPPSDPGKDCVNTSKNVCINSPFGLGRRLSWREMEAD